MSKWWLDDYCFKHEVKVSILLTSNITSIIVTMGHWAECHLHVPVQCYMSVHIQYKYIYTENLNIKLLPSSVLSTLQKYKTKHFFLFFGIAK